MANLSKVIPIGKSTNLLICLLLTSLLSRVAFAQADEVVFSASGGAPWRLYLGSSNNWMVPVSGPVTTAYKSKVVTVNRIE